jgi:hypothetical protein
MSKNRWINTKFWSDGYIEELDPIEKLLFLYLLTNERTNVAGVYELPRKIMSVETGIEKSMLDNILARFEADGKIVTYEKYIRVMNSDTHQNMSNPKIQIGKKNVIDSLSTEVRDRLYIGYPYPLNNLDLDSDSDLDSEAKAMAVQNEQPKPVEKPVDEVAKAYYDTIKALKLPVRNHANLKSRIKAIEKDLGKEDALKYLNFVFEYYEKLDDDGYKPRLTEGLDIYAKRINIQAWIERKIIEQNKPATAAGGRPMF